MIPLVLMLVVIVGLLVMMAWPRIGTFIIWPILFTYPHSWWKYHGFLPLNIGYDDLFCIALFIITFVRRNLMDGVPIRFGYAFWSISCFCIILTIACISGATEPGAFVFYVYAKEIFKVYIFWCLFYSILHNVNDATDLKTQVTMFAFASMLGGLIVIGQYYMPYTFLPWSNPDLVEKYGVHFGERATGAFLNANGAAIVMGCSLVMVATAVKAQKTRWAKALVYGLMFVLLVAITVTRSRSGLMAVGLAFAAMAIFGRSKRVAWMMILGGLCVALVAGTIRDQYVARFKDVYNPYAGGWNRNVEGRFATWRSYLNTATAKAYVFGQGQAGGIRRNGMESHNTYISLLTVFGIGGAVWGLVVWLLFIKYTLAARGDPDPLLGAVAWGCLFSMVALMAYGFTSDAVSSNYPRYLLFYLLVLVDRIRYLTRQPVLVGESGQLLPREQEDYILDTSQEILPRGSYELRGMGY